jgi:hypothetical protein
MNFTIQPDADTSNYDTAVQCLYTINTLATILSIAGGEYIGITDGRNLSESLHLYSRLVMLLYQSALAAVDDLEAERKGLEERPTEKGGGR